jgi:hypothetical protein
MGAFVWRGTRQGSENTASPPQYEKFSVRKQYSNFVVGYGRL